MHLMTDSGDMQEEDLQPRVSFRNLGNMFEEEEPELERINSAENTNFNANVANLFEAEDQEQEDIEEDELVKKKIDDSFTFNESEEESVEDDGSYTFGDGADAYTTDEEGSARQIPRIDSTHRRNRNRASVELMNSINVNGEVNENEVGGGTMPDISNQTSKALHFFDATPSDKAAPSEKPRAIATQAMSKVSQMSYVSSVDEIRRKAAQKSADAYRRLLISSAHLPESVRQHLTRGRDSARKETLAMKEKFSARTAPVGTAEDYRVKYKSAQYELEKKNMRLETAEKKLLENSEKLNEALQRIMDLEKNLRSMSVENERLRSSLSVINTRANGDDSEYEDISRAPDMSEGPVE